MTQEPEQSVQLSISELATRTGVAEGTLRMWERRHAFPVPERLPSGHRRYRAEDVERVARVLREREAGLSVSAAIERARRSGEETEPSLFAGIRRRRPDLQPIVLRKPLLLALTRAIEDESCAQAERPLLFGSFQRERFFRASARRWREFARTAELAVVFADFERFRAGPPAEVPVDGAAPLTREWAVVCSAPGHAVCLSGLELPTAGRRSDGAREFEVLWSVEPAVVQVATEICLGLLPTEHPGLADTGSLRSTPASDQQLRLATAITTRAFGRLS